jgi:CDP-diglyceride synthetase
MGYAMLAMLFDKLGSKGFLLTFWVSTLALTPLFMIYYEDPTYFHLLLLLTKLSVASLFGAIYIINIKVF